ncbi:class I SAM-dependent methyltransferase [Sphingobium ummariense]|uniref:class I SAM-dependent methyltransferase n=1 Tax=Sphingobium ummariense TaxID=420994 RepID=UPI001F270BF3|nr:methyltransferase domain-containing protein [Sphingobium ummariense]
MTILSPLPTLPPLPDHWFHSFRFPDGTQVTGIKPFEGLMAEADQIFDQPMEGRRVLDIGAWDGFFSFEAERRGAAEVLATDHFCWSGEGWGDKRGFDHAHARFGSKVRALDLDVEAHRPEELGTFDTVLLLGVLYHVTDPYRTLQAAAAMSHDHLVIETVTALRHEQQPAMRLFTELELDRDSTNYWAPNILALREMCRRFGFTRFAVKPASLDNLGWRRLAMPFRRKDRYRRAIVHAWR